MSMSPYVTRIRSLIGHDLLVMPTVAVIPRDDRGRVLLVRQAHNNLWTTVGGAVEPGESPAEAAVREATEEAGVTVRLESLLGAFGGADYEFAYPNGDKVACVVVAYAATVSDGAPTPDGDETTEVGWFHLTELPDDLNPLAKTLVLEAGLLSEARA